MSVNLDRWTSGSDYDQWMGRWSRLLAEQFLEWLDIPSGARWLDVCCGSGVVTELIAERCSPTSIVGIDAAPAQIEFAREHRKRPVVTFEVCDATAIPFPGSAFDVVVCALGLNYISDPAQALREMRRVTRADGTIAVYVWDYAEGAAFLRRFWDVATSVDPEASKFDQARRFPMCTPSGLRTLFEAVHFKTVEIDALEIVTRFENFEDYWVPLLSGQGSAPNYLVTRSEEIKAEIQKRLRASLQPGGKKSIELPARAWAVRTKTA